MPKVIFIDKHIRNRQGHHLEYCLRSIKAFARAGWESGLVTNVTFAEKITGIDVRPILHFQPGGGQQKGLRHMLRLVRAELRDICTRYENRLIYSRTGRILAPAMDSLIGRGKSRARPQILKPVTASVKEAPKERGGLRLRGAVRKIIDLMRPIINSADRPAVAVERQAENLRETLRAMGTTSDDILIFSTFTLSDLAFLLRLVQGQAVACRSLNIIFREPLFPNEMYPLQLGPEQRVLRECFLEIGKTGVPMRYWVDSPELAQQYDLLAVATFGVLPVIVPEEIGPIARKKAERSPAPIPCFGSIGDARQEKGYGLLPGMIERINEGKFGKPEATFFIQSNYNVPGGYPLTRAARLKLLFQDDLGVRLTDQMMTSEAYLAALERLDVVLIAYRHPSYCIGSSGILVEALAAGMPVVATEYTWGGRQIRESAPYIEHMKNFVRDYALPDKADFASDMDRVDLPARLTHLAVSAAYGMRSVGDILYITLEQWDKDGKLVGSKRRYYSGRRGEATAIWGIDPVAARVSIKPCCLNARLSREACRFDVIFCDTKGAHVPLGALGVLIDEPQDLDTDVEDFARGVQEMIDHFPHYRATALAHVDGWLDRHGGPALMQALITGQSPLTSV